ncbi:MAG: hypothetical protein LUC87_05610, partial [Clostridiales bacterium]|nr:hypothetical protein [Clostridiales bacterium]
MGMTLGFLQAADKNRFLLVAGVIMGMPLGLLKVTDKLPVLVIAAIIMGVPVGFLKSTHKLLLRLIAGIIVGVPLPLLQAADQYILVAVLTVFVLGQSAVSLVRQCYACEMELPENACSHNKRKSQQQRSRPAGFLMLRPEPLYIGIHY